MRFRETIWHKLRTSLGNWLSSNCSKPGAQNTTLVATESLTSLYQSPATRD